MDNRKKPIEQQRKYLYESYMGIHGGFCKPVTVLSAEMIGYSPAEIYKNISIYSAYMSCDVTRPEFDTDEERNIAIILNALDAAGQPAFGVEREIVLVSALYNSRLKEETLEKVVGSCLGFNQAAQEVAL